MNCNRCGKCCESTFFALRDVPVDKDTREIGRWASYHGVKTMKYNIDGVDCLAINLPDPCEHLETKDNLFYSCKIYKTRPQVCKDFFCKEMTDKMVLELVEAECIKPI